MLKKIKAVIEEKACTLERKTRRDGERLCTYENVLRMSDFLFDCFGCVSAGGNLTYIQRITNDCVECNKQCNLNGEGVSSVDKRMKLEGLPESIFNRKNDGRQIKRITI